MQNYFVLLLVGVAALALFNIVTWIQNAARARRLGCRNTPMYPDCGMLGFKHAKLQYNAAEKGMYLEFLNIRQRVMSKVTGRTCSTFKYKNLGSTAYFTCDPQNIKALLLTQFSDFEFGPVRRKIFREVFGNGIFAQDGSTWKRSRASLRHYFVRDQVSDFDTVERHVQNLLDVLLRPHQRDGWTAFTDIQLLFFRLSMDITTEYLCGQSVNTQLSENSSTSSSKSSQVQDECAFATNFDRARLIMTKRLSLHNLYWLCNPDRYKMNVQVVKDFVRHIVDTALQKSGDARPIRERHGNKANSVLEELIAENRDPEILCAEILHLLLGSRDSTGSILSWLFYELPRNPQVFERLRKDIIDHFGTDDHSKTTLSELKGCQYLQHTLNEVLRLRSIVPINNRRSNKATTLPRGGGSDGQSPIFIHAGATVEFSVHTLHMREDIWGKDSNEFKPERFIGRKLGWEYLPFGGGPRICIGRQLGIARISYIVVRLLQRFDKIEASPSSPNRLGEPVPTKVAIATCPAEPVTIRLHIEETG